MDLPSILAPHPTYDTVLIHKISVVFQVSAEPKAPEFEKDCEVLSFPQHDLRWLSKFVERPLVSRSLHLAVTRTKRCKAIDRENEDTCGENAWRAPWDTLISTIVDEMNMRITDASVEYM